MSRLLLIRYLKHWRSLHCRQCFLSSSHQRNSHKLLHTQSPEAVSLRNNKEPSRKVKLRSSWRYDVGFLNTDFGEHFQNWVPWGPLKYETWNKSWNVRNIPDLTLAAPYGTFHISHVSCKPHGLKSQLKQSSALFWTHIIPIACSLYVHYIKTLLLVLFFSTENNHSLGY